MSKSFLGKFESSLGEQVYLVTGNDAGRDLWHYVLVDKAKLPLFKRMVNSPTIDVAEYGKVLYSGWGKEPPQEITEKIKQDYS
ncbi:MAG TPA: hypothetical protein VFT64_07750 [Rickettsiales bacterium]|nr:hypothetical protein [Rickettsiales bacterium]